MEWARRAVESTLLVNRLGSGVPARPHHRRPSGRPRPRHRPPSWPVSAAPTGPQGRPVDRHRPRLRDPAHRHAGPLRRPRHHHQQRRSIDNILSIPIPQAPRALVDPGPPGPGPPLASWHRPTVTSSCDNGIPNLPRLPRMSTSARNPLPGPSLPSRLRCRPAAASCTDCTALAP
jgi:hypothetical protein